MSMSEFFWSDVDSDAAREQHEAQVERARVAVAGAWPFLSEATSRNDYLNRLSLVEDRIHNAVASATSTDAEFASVLGALHESLDRDWYTLREARVREARAKRAQRQAAREYGACPYCGASFGDYDARPGDMCQACGETLPPAAERKGTRKRAQGDEIEPSEPTGQGASDVGDVPTPGQEVADYPQPEGESDPNVDPNGTPSNEGGDDWANEDGEAAEETDTEREARHKRRRAGGARGRGSAGLSLSQARKTADHASEVAALSPTGKALYDILMEVRERFEPNSRIWYGSVSDHNIGGVAQETVRQLARQSLRTGGDEQMQEFTNRLKEAIAAHEQAGFRIAIRAWTMNDVWRVASNWQHETVDGQVLDPTSATLLVQVYQAFGKDRRQALCNQPLDEAVSMAAKVVSRASRKAGRKVPAIAARRLTKSAMSVKLVSDNGEVIVRAPGESKSSIKRMLRGHNISARVIDNGDDTFEVSVAKSQAQDAAKILRSATRKHAASTLDEAIETALQNLPIQKQVVKPEAQTGYTILQRADGRYSVHEDSVWGDRSGGFLPSSGPPEGTPVAKVDLDGNVQRLGSRTATLNAGDRVEVISDTESQDGSTTIPAGSVLTIQEVEDQGDPDARGTLLHTTFNGNPVYLSEGDVRKSSSRRTAGAFEEAHRLGQPNPPYHVTDQDPSGTAHTVVCDVPGCVWSAPLTNVAPNFLWIEHAQHVQGVTARRTAGPNSQIKMMRDYEDPQTGFMFEDGTTWDFVGSSEVGWQVEVGDPVTEIVEVPYEAAILVRKSDRRRSSRRKVATFFVKEYLPDGSAVQDNPAREFDDPQAALREVERLEAEDRANGLYQPDRWRIVEVSPQVRDQSVDMLHDLSTARKVEVEQVGPRQFLWAISDDERLYGSGIAPTRSLARREAARHLADNSRSNNPYTPVGEGNPFGEQGNPYDLTGEDVTDQGPMAEDTAGPVSIEGPPQTTRPRGGGEQDGAAADPNSPEGPQPVGEANQ